MATGNNNSASRPTLDKTKAEQINLSVIQRLDSEVEQVIATAGHVALYDFDVSTSQWSRKDVEGSLFLVKRRGAPRFRFVILNKKGDDNFWENVGSDFSCEKQEPYVMYRNGGGTSVIGIWFYETEDCQKFAELFEKISTTFAAPSDASIHIQPAVPVQGSPAPGGTWNAQQANMHQNNANPLAQVFAGMKVAPPPPSASSLPLLTPQHFGSGGERAPPTTNNQGAALLQSLNDQTSKNGVDEVQELLRNLSQNRAFCEMLHDEMRRVGFQMSSSSR